jgi:hypothetical protein
MQDVQHQQLQLPIASVHDGPVQGGRANGSERRFDGRDA